MVSCVLPPGLVPELDPRETGNLLRGVVQVKQSSNPGVIAAGAARAWGGGEGGSARLNAPMVLQASPASDGLALGGGRGAGPAVTADGHGVGVEGVDPRGTVGQLDGHLFGLVVGTDSMVGFDVGGLQNGLLSPQVENREPLGQRYSTEVPQEFLNIQHLTI